MANKSKWKRLTVTQLHEQRAQLVRQLPDLKATLYGSVQRQVRQCGQAGCRCAKGEPHGPYHYLAVRVGGRARLLYVPAASAATVQRYVEQTGRIEEALAEISAINRELLARGALD
jgi:hypothetical protein